MRKLLIKIAALAIVVILVQIGLYEYVVPKIPEVSRLDHFLRNGEDILYFGDSVIDYVDPNDKDHSSIADMLTKLDSKDSIGDMSKGGYLPSLYEAMMEYISHSPNKPRAIILPINLASLSLPWFMVPGEQFEKERFVLAAEPSFIADFWRPLAILGAVKANSVSEKQFLETPVYYGDKELGTVFDFTKTKKFSSTTEEEGKSTYIARYMYSLSTSSPTIKPLEKIVDMAIKDGIKIYAYITPINYEEGERVLGNDFLTQNRHNIDVACSLFEAKGFPCLDIAFAVKAQDFQYPQGHASEHIKQSGRSIVAQKIYTLLK